jgi:DNA-binding transcriptional regulator YdaS (Cro superfamily)
MTQLNHPSGLDGLRRAVELAGSQAALAKLLDEIGQRQQPPMQCKPQNVWAWLNRDLKVPSEWARLISEAVDFRVPPADLRPDLYPHPDDGLPDDRRGRAAA